MNQPDVDSSVNIHGDMFNHMDVQNILELDMCVEIPNVGIDTSHDTKEEDESMYIDDGQEETPVESLTNDQVSVDRTDKSSTISSSSANSKSNPYDFPSYMRADIIRNKMSEHERCLLRLLLLLKSAGTPKYLFDSILSWLRDTYSRCGSNFLEHKHKKREAFLKKFDL